MDELSGYSLDLEETKSLHDHMKECLTTMGLEDLGTESR